jgi:hypothetical protein
MCVILPPENKHTVKLYEEALFTQGFLLSEHFNLGATVDADYVVWRTIFDINKVLVNLQ